MAKIKTGIFLVLLALSFSFARPTLIIMDASGSMEDPMDSGMTRIQAAKIAAKELVDGATDEVALMVYTDCDWDGNPNSGPIHVVVDFTMDKQLLKQEIDGITPDAGTPIAKSIEEGAAYVGSTGRNAGIVLLTDGEETCDYLYPEELAQIAGSNGVEIINIVGFQLYDDYVKQDMEAVAVAGGGSYYDAQDLATLKTSMKQAYSSASGSSYSCCGAPAFALAAAGAIALSRRQ